MQIPVGHSWHDITEDDIRRIQKNLFVTHKCDIDTKILDAVLSYFILCVLRKGEN